MYNSSDGQLFRQDRLATRPLTLVLGARCKDGVVLVADTKVIINDGERYDYVQKIFTPLAHLVFACAGSSDMFQVLDGHLREYIRDHPDTTFENVTGRLREILFDINRQNNFRPELTIEALVANAPDDKPAFLTWFNAFGGIRPIEDACLIGVGRTYASTFLNNLFSEGTVDTPMIKLAELGYFSIKYIEKFKLDLRVGVGRGKPSIHFIPDRHLRNKWDFNLKPHEMKKLGNKIKEKLEIYNVQFTKLFNS